MSRVSQSVFPVSPLVNKVLASRPVELPSSLPLCSSNPTFVPSKTSSTSEVFSESNAASTSIKSSPEVVIPASQQIRKRALPNCSSCGQLGHRKNQKVCPNFDLPKIPDSLSAAIAEVSNVVDSLAVTSEVTAEDNVQPLSDNSFTKFGQFNECNFCKTVSASCLIKNNYLICGDCLSVDTLRPFVKIPNQLSPKGSIPFSIAFRSFTLALSLGSWDVLHIWKFFLEKQSQSCNRPKKVFAPKKLPKDKVVRQQLLRGRYGSAKNAIFSSDLAPVSEDTVSHLQALHPLEKFSPVKPMPSLYWKENPIRVDELMSCILKLPSGKAPGPSGITFDMLKSVVPPKELSASRLVALIKPNKKIRPIAVGEAIYGLFASVVFERISNKAKDFFSPYQYGIKTIDGASVAALSSDVFFNAVENNCIFNLDFKNAFNSVKRSAICSELEKSFPELGTFFIVFMVTLLT
ncbi:hypothetical protein GEMRC1_013924 [Eukaryota sp. GEM-RC1]